MNEEFSLSKLKNQNEQNIVLEQYKMLIDSINRINDTRELSNGFWVAVNSVGISALAYLRDSSLMPPSHKSILLIALIILGAVFSLSWISYLATIKNSIEIRSELLVKLEKSFPIPIFSKVFSLSEEGAGRAALTVKEMLVPCLFLIGYLFFAVLLFLFPQEVMSTLEKS